MSHQLGMGIGKSLMQKNREDTDVLNAKGFRGTWKTIALTAAQEWMVMKMRLIDADALKEIISGNSYILRDSINSMNFGMFWDGIEQAIDESPTIDAVPIVWCKDCRYYQDNNGGYPNADCKWCKDETPDANDYCSCGERKDDES